MLFVLPGSDDPRAIVAFYRRHGAAGLVGVKCGTRGIVLSSAEGCLIEVPCIPAPGPVIDTTGAGDSFLGGLVMGLAREMPLEAAARLGAATAACCVTRAGATAGLLGLEQTMRLAGL
ncbi:MAG: PfkB family carbohydrate kinase [Planctomycetaceae bacterium]